MKEIKTRKEFENEINDGVVLVDFFAQWCGPCKMLSPVLEELQQDLKEKIKVIKVDIDQHMELTQEYKVTTVPTVFMFSNGKIQESLVGFKPKNILDEVVKKYL